MKTHLSSSFGRLLIVALTNLAWLAVVVAGEPQTVRLLTVGNSFSRNATRYLPDLVKAGGHTLIHKPIVVGGASLQLHAEKFQKYELDASDKAGCYTNGQSKAIARVQLADFKNLNGLQPIGGNEWKAPSASGEPLPLGAPGSGVYGLLQSGALEESNVDLTGELVNMIVAQRAYQANAQTIKTEDQVLQTLVNLR